MEGGNKSKQKVKVFQMTAALLIGSGLGFFIGINQCPSLPPSPIPVFGNPNFLKRKTGGKTPAQEAEMYTHHNFEEYAFWDGFNLYYDKSWSQISEKTDQPQSLVFKLSKEGATMELIQGPIQIGTCIYENDTTTGEEPFVEFGKDYFKIKKNTNEVWRLGRLKSSDTSYKVCQRDPSKGTFLDTTYAGTIDINITKNKSATLSEIQEILKNIEKLDPGNNPVND